MRQTFERGPELERETRQLPVEFYRKILSLRARNDDDRLFVLIASMQYVAVFDQEEILFLDAQGPRFVELAWCDFHPGNRAQLNAPVGYTCIYYKAQARATMQRLQGEFYKSLARQLDRRLHPVQAASVTSLKGRGEP